MNDVDPQELVDALAAVERLHGQGRDGYCRHDHRPWPCPTIRLIGGLS